MRRELTYIQSIITTLRTILAAPIDAQQIAIANVDRMSAFLVEDVERRAVAAQAQVVVLRAIPDRQTKRKARHGALDEQFKVDDLRRPDVSEDVAQLVLAMHSELIVIHLNSFANKRGRNLLRMRIEKY